MFKNHRELKIDFFISMFRTSSKNN